VSIAAGDQTAEAHSQQPEHLQRLESDVDRVHVRGRQGRGISLEGQDTQIERWDQPERLRQDDRGRTLRMQHGVQRQLRRIHSRAAPGRAVRLSGLVVDHDPPAIRFVDDFHDDAGYINGEGIMIDGGSTLHGFPRWYALDYSKPQVCDWDALFDEYPYKP